MSDIKYLHQLAVSSNFYNLQEIGHENLYKETKRKVSFSNKVLENHFQNSHNEEIEHFTNLDAPILYKMLDSCSSKSPARYSISDGVSSQSQASSSSDVFNQKEVDRKKKKRKAKIFGLGMIPVVLIIIIIVIVVVLLTDTDVNKSNCFIIKILI